MFVVNAFKYHGLGSHTHSFLVSGRKKDLNGESPLPMLFYPELGLIFAWETSLISSNALRQWGLYVESCLPTLLISVIELRIIFKSHDGKYQFLKLENIHALINLGRCTDIPLAVG